MRQNSKLTAASVASQLLAILSAASKLDDLIIRRRDYTGPLREERAEWTNALLNTVLKAGRDDDFKVYPTRRYFSRTVKGGRNSCYDSPGRPDDESEHLLDACWTTYPSVWPVGIDALPEAPRIVLAAEIEWGALDPRQDVAWHERLLLDDFSKLAVVKADAKLFIGSYFTDADYQRVLSRAKILARGDSATYELVMWPWNATFASRNSFKRESW